MDARIGPDGRLQVVFGPTDASAISAYLRGCPELSALYDFVDDGQQLDSEASQPIVEHLNRCATCREVVDDYREALAFSRTPEGRRVREEADKRFWIRYACKILRTHINKTKIV